jgi:alcohol dehydrogenase class IV
MQFEFATADRIIFGIGSVAQVIPAAAEHGSRAFLVHGRSVERSAPVRDGLAAAGLEPVGFAVDAEPTTDLLLDACSRAREAKCNVVVGVGGGSVLDTAKAVSALLTNRGDLFDYLEVIGRGQSLQARAAPCIAVPTTAGTGAEVTRNAVLDVPGKGVKVSLRSPLMLPALAVVDPALTLGVPPALTSSTGLDAFTQLLEAYVSNRANPITHALCREGLARAARSLRAAFENGNDLAAREDMSLASLFGGLALANAKLGAVHGFAGPLGGMLHAPHGAVCAALLPHTVAMNVRALQDRDPANPALLRYEEVARLLCGRAKAGADDAAEWIARLCRDLAVPSLADLGMSPDLFDEAIAKAQRSSSMKGNPIELTPPELEILLAAASRAE